MIQYRDPFQEITSFIASNYPTTSCLYLAFENCKVRVRSNSFQLVATLESYYRNFLVDGDAYDLDLLAIEDVPPYMNYSFKLKEPDPGKSKIKEEYVDVGSGRIVRKRLTGMLFIFGEETNIAIGPSLANYNQVVNFINNRFIQRLLHQGCQLYHASAVVYGNHGMALAGFSGMGKSTLAMHLMSSGAKFVSNDRLLLQRVSNQIHFYGVPKLPRINPGTALNNPDLHNVISESDREKFARLEDQELFQLEHKYDVDIDECFGSGSIIQKAEMNSLILLNWRDCSSNTELKRINLRERRDLFPTFMKTPGLFYQSNGTEPKNSETAYLQMLEGCPVYEMTGQLDFRKGTELCLDILLGKESAQS